MGTSTRIAQRNGDVAIAVPTKKPTIIAPHLGISSARGFATNDNEAQKPKLLLIEERSALSICFELYVLATFAVKLTLGLK